jgi:subtilisin family serine protease
MMKQTRGKLVLFAILTVIVMVFILASLSLQAHTQTTLYPQVLTKAKKDRTVFDKLEQKAWTEGSVNVIVRLDVPRIWELIAASSRFGTGDTRETVKQERVAADEALKEAIELTAWRVISDLYGTEFKTTNIYSSIPFLALKVTPQALNLLYNSSDILGIEENVPIKLDDPIEDSEVGNDDSSASGTTPDRPFLLYTTQLIGARNAWEWGLTGKGWYVAILDTGIRKTHEFFKGKSIIEACFALGRDGTSGSGDCPNGYSTMIGSGSAAHHPSNYSGFDHGTHVSGIAAGDTALLYGVAPSAGIISVQVFSRFTPSDCGTSSPCVLSWTSDQLAGLDYIYSIRGSYPIAAVNMSIGAGGYSSFCDSDSRKMVIDNLRAAGIATVIATGNDSYCGYVSAPSCISSAVSVGSSTDSDAESYFNNWSPTLQRLFAPGSQIYSSTGTSDSSYASWSGTSMATPHVTGAWAILKQAVPNGSVTDLLSWLRVAGISVKSICDSYTQAIPRIQVDRSLQIFVTFDLTLQSSAFGNTDPLPGKYSYSPGDQFQIAAKPDEYAVFTGWSGDASGTENPLTVKMTGNRTIQANFRYINPPTANGQQVMNRNFSQAEYINILSWQSHPDNSGLNISNYRIYSMSGDTATFLAEVEASATTYSHRNAGKESRTYAIVAVVNGDREGAPALVTVQ